MAGITYTKEKVHLNLARLKKGPENFEVVINSDFAIDYRAGRSKDLKAVLVDEKIFSDAKKGLLASEHRMQQVFKTSDSLKVAEEILKHGEIQLTVEQRAKMIEKKKRKIISLIQRNAVDPKTHLPHPITRIENAFEEAKVRIDYFRAADEQIKDIIRQLTPILPIKFEAKEIEVIIPAPYGAKSYAIVKNFGKIKKDEWLNDGSWLCVIEMPAGLETDFYDKLNSLTHGKMQSKVLNIRS